MKASEAVNVEVIVSVVVRSLDHDIQTEGKLSFKAYDTASMPAIPSKNLHAAVEGAFQMAGGVLYRPGMVEAEIFR